MLSFSVKEFEFDITLQQPEAFFRDFMLHWLSFHLNMGLLSLKSAGLGNKQMGKSELFHFNELSKSFHSKGLRNIVTIVIQLTHKRFLAIL